MKLWICRKKIKENGQFVECGHEVVSTEKPQPIRWNDGHVCEFTESDERKGD